MSDMETDDLQRIKLFRDLPDKALAAIAQECAWHSFAKGEEVLAKDSDSMDVYFVAKGTVQVVNFSLSGREVAYAKIPEGEYFGELAAIDTKPRSTNVVAATKCRLASLRPAKFEQVLLEHPGLAWQVLQKLTGIVRSLDERIMDMSTLNAHQRLYAELLRRCEPDPLTPDRFQIYPMPTQSDMASLIGTTRETVARGISNLVSGELIRRKGKTLYILDKERLEELSDRLATDA